MPAAITRPPPLPRLGLTIAAVVLGADDLGQCARQLVDCVLDVLEACLDAVKARIDAIKARVDAIEAAVVSS